MSVPPTSNFPSTPNFPPASMLPPEPSKPNFRRRRLMVGGGALLVLLGLLYLGAAAISSDRLPRNAVVQGVAVGGLSAPQAKERVGADLEPRLSEPVTLTSSAAEVSVPPKDLGLGIDLDATIDPLVGFSLAPAAVWSHLGGKVDRPVVTTLDEAAYTEAMASATKKLNAKPVEGEIEFPKGKVSYTKPTPGATTKVDATKGVLTEQWPGSSTIAVAEDTEQPKVDAASWDKAKADFADVAVSAPVSVTAGEKTFAVTPAEYAKALSVAVKDGVPQGVIGSKELVSGVSASGLKAGAVVKAKDAVVTFSGSTPAITDSVTGTELDPDSVVNEVGKAIRNPGKRLATVTTKTVQPEFTTDEARATLPREQIATFTTNYACCLPRTHNIQTAARKLNGTYVPPGETFSLNATLGQRTAASGYLGAPVIYNGRLTTDYGGGISQLSTTLFNAAFFSGVELVQWTPHSFYISRYPEGREATISWPNVDQKWKNTTDAGILIQAIATDTSVTVNFRGVKKYDVKATKGERYNVRQPKVIEDDSEGCVPQSPSPGFDVQVGRIISRNGTVVARQTITTHYIPEDDVTCTKEDP